MLYFQSGALRDVAQQNPYVQARLSIFFALVFSIPKLLEEL
jgi:hypothetical protein